MFIAIDITIIIIIFIHVISDTKVALQMRDFIHETTRVEFILTKKWACILCVVGIKVVVLIVRNKVAIICITMLMVGY